MPQIISNQPGTFSTVSQGIGSEVQAILMPTGTGRVAADLLGRSGRGRYSEQRQRGRHRRVSPHDSGRWAARSHVTATWGRRTSNITALSTTADLAVGDSVSGTGIPAGAVITAIVNGTTVTISPAPTTAGTTVPLDFHVDNFQVLGSQTSTVGQYLVRFTNNLARVDAASFGFASGTASDSAAVLQGTVLTPSSSTVQIINRGNIGTGSTTFSFNGANSAAINIAAGTTLTQIRTTLETIPALDPTLAGGSVISVTGVNGGPWTVTFNSALARTGNYHAGQQQHGRSDYDIGLCRRRRRLCRPGASLCEQRNAKPGRSAVLSQRHCRGHRAERHDGGLFVEGTGSGPFTIIYPATTASGTTTSRLIDPIKVQTRRRRLVCPRRRPAPR